MAKVYANLCANGVRNFNDIPESLKDAVRSILKSDGYTINADGTVTKE